MTPYDDNLKIRKFTSKIQYCNGAEFVCSQRFYGKGEGNRNWNLSDSDIVMHLLHYYYYFHP
jgi:hypothetical protein